MKEVGGPQVSPDGKWIAYTVTSMDREADKLRSAIWMVNWEGTQDYQVTRGPDSDTSPRWSPDGRYLAFLSASSLDHLYLFEVESRKLEGLTGEKDFDESDPVDLWARFSRLLTSPPGRGYGSTMDWGASSMPGGGIQRQGREFNMPWKNEMPILPKVPSGCLEINRRVPRHKGA